MHAGLPLRLYKASIELQLQIARLFQEANHRWLEALHQRSADGIDETTAQIQDLSNIAERDLAITLPVQVFWRMLQGGLTDAQSINQVALKSQAALANSMREALVSWQQDLGTAFGVEDDAVGFARLCQQWTQPWAVSEAPAGMGPAGEVRT